MEKCRIWENERLVPILVSESVCCGDTHEKENWRTRRYPGGLVELAESERTPAVLRNCGVGERAGASTLPLPEIGTCRSRRGCNPKGIAGMQDEE